jgi:hypothetical protein
MLLLILGPMMDIYAGAMLSRRCHGVLTRPLSLSLIAAVRCCFVVSNVRRTREAFQE